MATTPAVPTRVSRAGGVSRDCRAADGPHGPSGPAAPAQPAVEQERRHSSPSPRVRDEHAPFNQAVVDHYQVQQPDHRTAHHRDIGVSAGWTRQQVAAVARQDLVAGEVDREKQPLAKRGRGARSDQLRDPCRSRRPDQEPRIGRPPFLAYDGRHSNVLRHAADARTMTVVIVSSGRISRRPAAAATPPVPRRARSCRGAHER
jgi:hypothetical protein